MIKTNGIQCTTFAFLRFGELSESDSTLTEALPLNLMDTFDDYIIFVDESGDHGLVSIDSNYPIFVLAFCLFEKRTYAEEIAPAILKLKFKHFGHDQVILHERDIRKARGHFSFLQNKGLREPFLRDLNDLVEQSKFLLIASAIKKYKLNRQYTDPDNPYHIAMAFGLERIFLHLKSLGCRTGKSFLIFESRGKKEDNDIELEFRRVCDRNATEQQLPFEIIIADKKCNSAGLQLADLIARPIGRKILKPDQPNRAFEIIKTKFRRDSSGKVKGWGLKLFP